MTAGSVGTRRAFRVFLSSTAEDLCRYRAAVVEAFARMDNVKPVNQESFGARGGGTVAECRRLVAESDVVVAVVAHRYGWIPTVDEGGDGERSITALEIEAADAAGRPVLGFLVDEEHRWSEPTEQDALKKAASEGEAAEVWRRVKLLAELKSSLLDRIKDTFETPADLAAKVTTAVSNELGRLETEARITAESTVETRQLELTRIGTAELQRFGQIEPSVLGVRRSGLTDRVDDAGLPTYVHRVIDTAIDRALNGAQAERRRLVVVAGHPKSGKTRTLYEAVRRLGSPGRRVFAVWPPSLDDYRPLERLIKLTDQLGAPEDLIIWIDDAHEHLERGLTRHVLSELTRLLPGAIVAMTSHLAPLREGDSRAGKQVTELLLRAAAETILDRSLTDSELAEAQTVHPELADRADLPFLAEVLAAVPELRDKFEMSDQPVGKAIVEAAIIWRRAGMVAAITRHDLRALTEVGYQAIQPLDDAAFSAGLDWATAPVTSSWGPALLIAEGAESWRVFDAIADEAEVNIGGQIWDYLFDVASPEDLVSMGYAAEQEAHPEITEQAWRSAAERGNSEGMTALGFRAEEKEDFASAEEWFRKAVALEDRNAMGALAALLEERGMLEEAEAWFRRAAADQDDSNAMFMIGQFLMAQDQPDEAETWWRRAADFDGWPFATWRLGELLMERHETDEAEPLLRQSVESGLPFAMSSLGLIHYERGDVEEAEALWRRAVEQGWVFGVARLLAKLMDERGDSESAEQWLELGADSGDAEAMALLGMRAEERNEAATAEGWYRRGAELSDPASMTMLGLVLAGRGEEAEAEEWYRKGAKLDNAMAMSALGELLVKRGEEAEAEVWLRKGADLDDAISMTVLGSLLAGRGEIAEAEEWYRRGAELDDPAAMNALGYALFEREEFDEAIGWCQRAVENGMAAEYADDDGRIEAMDSLGCIFQAQGRLEDAENWFRRAAEAGHPNSMNALGLILEEQHQTAESKMWLARAAEAGFELPPA